MRWLSRIVRSAFQYEQMAGPVLDGSRMRRLDRLFSESKRRLLAERVRGDARIRIGWISSWNAKCGIAMYSKFLLDSLDACDFDITVFASYLEKPLGRERGNVVRCWGNSQTMDIFPLLERIARLTPSVVVIQFQFAFFTVAALGAMLDVLTAQGVRTIVVFHSTESEAAPSLETIRASLSRAFALLVHSRKDHDLLVSFGLRTNLSLFPHGITARPAAGLEEAKAKKGFLGKRVMASYGFLLPHKGIERLIEAFSLLLRSRPDLHLLLVNALYPIEDSEQTMQRCRERIQSGNLQKHVTMVTEFLPDEESLEYLECADLIVFPYTHTQESSSAALRFGLSANRPVACTPLRIFDDVREAVHLLPGFSAEEISRGIDGLLRSPELLGSLERAQRQWIEEHEWSVVGRRLSALIRSAYNSRVV